VRITLNGLGVIQQYCRDDRLVGRTFSAMIKDRTARDANLNLEDYGVNIKCRRERELDEKDPEIIELLGQWPVEQKAFRLLRRWTFRGQGIRFDLSMVRQTKRNARGEFRWVSKFAQQDISIEPALYEIEVELERLEDDTVDTALQRLVKGVGEVLRGIQKNTLLIRNSTKQQVLAAYRELTRTDRFRGVSTRTLELKNMISQVEPNTPNIREGYNVTDKADGLRTMGYVNDSGRLYLIDNAMNVYETGLLVEKCAKSLVDGEWITKNTANESIHQYLIFDIYIAPGGRDVHTAPFFDGVPGAVNRYTEMRNWEKLWSEAPGPKEMVKNLTSKTKLVVSTKKFAFAKGNEIFQAATKIFDTPRIYETDGLIFTKNDVPIPDQPQGDFKYQFKWKPPNDNTIDFMVVTEKIPGTTVDQIYNGFHPTSGKEIRYKVLRLHVGSREDPSKIKSKPRDIVLQNLPLQVSRGDSKYRPVLFQPEEFPDDKSNVCYVEVRTDMETGDEYAFCEVSDEPIIDKSIVEISYDASRAAGWRWVPKLVRKDKTERLLSGELGRTLNSNETAQSIWNSIHEPVTRSMIRTGAEEPTLDEVTAVSAIERERAAITQRYTDRTASDKDMNRVGPLRDFHNKYIKEAILYNAVMKKPGMGLIDIGMGRAPDIQKWRRVNAGAVLGIDIAGDSINNPDSGAYQRLWSTMLRNGREKVLPMAFVIGDASKNMVTGEAAATSEDKAILQSILGKVRPTDVVPPYIQNELANRFKMGSDVITCMFAIHYFFEAKDKFDSFLKNIAQNLKLGGFFMGCCFDGEKTFEFLRGHETRVGQEENTVLWKISKKYEADEIPAGDEAFGMPIDVEFISIGLPHREYLVPFKLLREKMQSIGCDLCNDEELKMLGLKNSTEMFGDSHKDAAKKGRKFPMTPAVEQFSFLSRWFVFRRKSDTGPVEVPEAVAPVVTGPTGPTGAPGESDDIEQLTSELQAATLAEEAAAVEEKNGAIGAKKQYAPAEVLQFYQEAAAQDRLKIGDKMALRWIAPGSPFSIQDPVNPAETYPSIEHFLAGMRYKVATDKPGLSQSIFGHQGSIHQKFARQRAAEVGVGVGAKPLSEDRDAKLLTEELKDVHTEMRAVAMKKWKAKFDEAKWNSVKDDLLTEAVRQRWEKDARFRTVVEAAKQQGKTLLFYTGSASSEYGGKRSQEGVLEGENKLGKAMMAIAGFEV
jgi:predicted NAD-dependent protein-ADP-ribosyltransferase YbiA (DUF1768 family)